MSLAIFGIRHHGPGSARSVVAALRAFAPDVVLVEGPPEADAIVPLAGDSGMAPPVAILVYATDDPKVAAFYPFAGFSPEWQALKYARDRGIEARFIDLPLANALAIRTVRPGDDGVANDDGSATDDVPTDDDIADDDGVLDAAAADGGLVARRSDTAHAIEADPLDAVARIAGYADGERWWDAFVEHRAAGDAFAALEELMRELRAARPRADAHELRREAAMRQAIRAARRAHERVAVVCGAWHAPALRDAGSAKADAETLRGLPKRKVAATWIPWTHGRLAFASGYGAGVASPGWYEHLWLRDGPPVAAWMAKAARVMREGGLDVAASHAIDAARLAETLAALRGASAVGLAEATDAIATVYAFGDPAPMALLHERLVIGERLGAVPESVPSLPLLADLAREQKRVRLAPEAAARALELDLRKPLDLERSRLLHRLAVLGVQWGVPRAAVTGASSTFRETWTLDWQPAFTLALIEASVYGSRVADAATGRASERAAKATLLAELTGTLDAVLHADLPDAVAAVLAALDALAARTHDVAHLLDAIPPLAHVSRYGDVRGTDLASVAAVLDALVARACVGLPAASLALDDEAASRTYARLVAVDAALRTLDVPAQRDAWDAALAAVAEPGRAHGLAGGRATRLRYDAGRIDVAALRRALALSLGRATTPDAAAAWIEGAFRDGGAVLVHEAGLLGALDGWLASLPGDAFTGALPLVRRTFATFARAERGAIATALARTAPAAGAPTAAQPHASGDAAIDWSRARLVLPALREIFAPAERA